MKLRLSLALVAIALWSAPALRGQDAPPADARIVAVGDIHGAAAGLAEILDAARLIDKSRKWIGGRARLVQTGDYLDRGADVRDALDLLIRLEGEARRAGGRVDVLFGNHEGMNVLRDLRDVSPAAIAGFADRRSEERRRKAFDTHADIARRAGGALDRDAWMAAHPPGLIEYLDAFGPRGKYGRWIRERKAVLQVDGTIFMHAGLNPGRPTTVDDVNRAVQRDVQWWDALSRTLERERLVAPFFTLEEVINAAQVEIGRISIAQKTGEPLGDHVTPEYVALLRELPNLRTSTLMDPEGPLWYRGLATLPEDALPQIEAMLRHYGAQRFVTGHTPQPGRITARFGGRAFLIDTGMLSSYYKGGRPSALELQGAQATAIYLSGREPVSAAAASPR